MKRVYQIGKHWEFHEEGLPESVEWVVKTLGFTLEEFDALPEGDEEGNQDEDEFSNTKIIDSIKFLPITDRVHAQMCILSHKGKYGLYVLDTCKYFGGPGKYVCPTDEAFPYDEIFLSNRIEGICYAACRKGDKWGIEKIVDADYVNPSEQFDNSYGLTKIRIIVPFENDSLESAQSRLIPWGKPVTDEEEEDY